jgi:hypothetical protein
MLNPDVDGVQWAAGLALGVCQSSVEECTCQGVFLNFFDEAGIGPSKAIWRIRDDLRESNAR